MTRIPRFVRTLGVALPVAMSLALGTIDAFAQGAPKVLHLVVPFGPGGGQDVLARSFNNELGAALGMTAVVEYKAGRSEEHTSELQSH